MRRATTTTTPRAGARAATRATTLLIALLIAAGLGRAPAPGASAAGQAGPILFVTQVPVPADFTTIGSTFGNHMASMDSALRGGDLWIRYPDGSLKNLTQAAGFGSPGAQQGADAIAVRDPSVHWSGTKAIFSMVVGAPTKQYDYKTYYWQLYEISGLGAAQTPVITKVPNQPAGYNNVSPVYGTDDRVIFTSDRPRGGEAHLYPQRDEYEEAPTVSGLWSLDPATGDLRLLNHAPSGDFTPTVDSYGRVIFTQWDHLQRDQQADADASGEGGYGTFDYAGEGAGAPALPVRTEVFPEPRVPPPGSNLGAHTFNQFFPWQINEDGTEAETLNHIGRHELHGYIPGTFTDDPNVVEYYGQYPRHNPNRLENFFQIKEDPTTPGRYFGVDAPEFGTHAAGQIARLDAPPSLDSDQISVTYVTHRDTASVTDEGAQPSPTHSGHYRDPLPLSDGTLIAAHTAETRAEGRGPTSRYDFRLKTVVLGSGGVYVAGAPLTAGISKSITYWSPDVLLSYSGPLWELQPVEVRARTRPAPPAPQLAPPEQQAFSQAGVDLATLQAYMRQHNLALIVTRNVTTRDDADKQQPFNLRVAGGSAQTTGAPGKVYDVAWLQIFQAQQLRGLTFGSSEPREGRRVLARPLMDPTLHNQPVNGPVGSVVVASDGSAAAFVPAGRATTWQLTDPAGAGVVRERYWLTFQAGEVRVCASCHGLNELNQAGGGVPQNTPQALRQLLAYWKAGGTDLQYHVGLPAIAR